MTMEVGFVLVTSVAGREREVFEELRKMPEIKDIHPLFGEYDIIVKLEGDSPDQIVSMVVCSIRKLPGVLDTKTLMRINGAYGKK
jgi:DNA-binding Lrp family transcriptional regulator